MPWFDPQPTPAQLAWWILPEGQNHKVSRWPRPGSDRALDARYRLLGTIPGGDATASKYLIQVTRSGSTDPVGHPDDVRWGWFDIPVQVPIGLHHETLPDPFDGLIADVNIDFDPASPEVGGPAVFTFIHLQTDDSPFGWNVLYQWDAAGIRPWRYNPDFELWPWSHRNHSNLGDWPWFDTEVRLIGMSDCYDFPPVPVAGGFAEIRAPDAWIQNRSFTPATTGFWRAEYDIRMPVNAQTFILTNSITGTHWLGQLPTRAQWGNQSVLFDTELDLDTWYHIDFRFQWDATDGLYRVSVDGGPETTNAGANQNLFFNRYGKRNGLPVEQDFDLKNFVFKHGTAISSVVVLDQKLQVNACDDGPDSRHGDTFNMTLPSCPL